MTEAQYHQQPAPASESRLLRVAIWVAIGALIAAAIVCVVWVLAGSQNGIIGRAFLTILLLAGFAGVALLDAHLAARRPPWFALSSMVTWVVILLIGAFLIWMPERWFGYGFGRFMAFLMIVLILQLALLHIRLYVRAYQRHVTPFTTAVTVTTAVLVVVLAFMLVVPLAFNEFFSFTDTYWRWVVAIAILAAVGTALVPLVNALFAPRRPREAVAAYGAAYGSAPQGWPTYADGVTPLPVLGDGSPDWNAYYTGYPSSTSQAIAPVAPVAIPGAPPAGWGHPAQQPWGEQSDHAGWAGSDPQSWPAPTQPYGTADPAQQPWVDPAQQGWQAPQQPWGDPSPQSWEDPSQQWADAATPRPWGDPSAWNDPAAPPAPPVPPGYAGYPPPPPLPPQQ
ncbi:hypothetical protein [Microbacterium ulmi]|uniref:Uncharacterized protein n=1 Tax=Microbacterium ulmi TaxID=179095 RepID=A0A7Y2PYP7_9MICO|nr:hypothetical protein [Microbacterium ulmi]NII68743.1 hypothetical protein [Microbacterium ulmi]NNH03596.1 hypothetical protein [Microbacterium ulmi]